MAFKASASIKSVQGS